VGLVQAIDPYFEEYGPQGGRPLVLLHGGLLTIELSFGSIIPGLAHTHRVIALELQGHGRTPDTDRPMEFDTLADDVIALLDRLGLPKADFLGYSLGGAVLLQLALRHPDRVNRLIIASVDYRPDDSVPLTEDQLPTQEDFQSMRDAYAAVAPDPDHFDDFAAKASGMVHAWTGWTDEQLASIAAPTLLVFGDLDFTPPSRIIAMHALMPDAQLAVLPGTNHMGVMRRPDILVPMVLTFLEEAT
jgi:pimeloyl-ACP methyl ester carboxylesterase